MTFIDLTGLFFGRLTVLKRVENAINYNALRWLCQCECGNFKIIDGSSLRRNGGTKSCGCLAKEVASKTHMGNTYTKGIPMLEEIKEKLRKPHPTNSGKKHYWYGRKHSEETKQKMKDNHADFSGEKHPQYNYNLTDEERIIGRKYMEYYEWRAVVYKRDSYTCQICGDNNGGNLTSHHFESYNNNPELRTTISNGITLCETCHNNFHSKYGRGNNTKKQFLNFVKKEVET